MYSICIPSANEDGRSAITEYPIPTPPRPLLLESRYLAATAEVMQKHYPERQSRILVVNAPWWFAGIWKGVSGVLSSGTQAKLQIRGTNFLPTLLEHVDASQVCSLVGDGR